MGARVRTVVVPAFAKLNLSLKVLYRRADGFHEIATVFQTIDLSDRVWIRWCDEGEGEVRVTADVEIPGENLAARAARAILGRGSVDIHIEKRIPMGGGLAGGSTDAAAVLRALPVLMQQEVPNLAAVAAQLGSDVPFFLHGGACEAHGRGELLEDLPDLGPVAGILVAPGLHMSTPEAYRALARPAETDLTPGAIDGIIEKFRAFIALVREGKALAQWGAFCENDFETPAFVRYPELAQQLCAIAETGTQLARMSGSGSTLYGLFDSGEAANNALRKLEGRTSGHVTAFQFLSRRQYERAWDEALSSIQDGAIRPWPFRVG